MDGKGGVGLVFVNDEGGSMFLHIHRVIPDGPADMSGMLSPGDRLVAIDGVEIGSAPPGDSPQLPGPHGTPVTLTFHRAANGRAFYEGCEFYTFNVNLTRSQDFFPDKLTHLSEEMEDTVHLAPRPRAWTAEPIAEQEFTSFGAPGNQSEFANSQLVDDILRSLNAPGAGAEDMPGDASTSLAQIPALAMSPPLPPEMAQVKLMQDQLNAANDKIRLLEEQLVREREKAASVTETQTASINSLVDQQQKSSQLVAELRQFIVTQSEEMQALRNGDAQSEERRREIDEYTEKTSAALRTLNSDLSATRRERDSVREELDRVLRDSQRDRESLEENLQAAKRELDAIKKGEGDINARLAQLSKTSQEREDQMKKKAESLAKEVVRLRAEIKRGGGGGVEAADEGDSKDNLPKDREQMLLSQISKLREENKELRDMAQSNEARSIGLHDTSVRPRLSNSPNISSNMPSSPQVTPMPDLKSPMSQPSESPRVVREDKRAVRSAAPPGSPPAAPPPAASPPAATSPATLTPVQKPPVSPSSGAEGMSVPARLDLELDLPFHEATQDREAFDWQLRLDVANALQGDLNKIAVLQLQPGSVVATLEVQAGFSSDGRSPLQIARQLVVEARNPSSKLRQGKITSFATRVRSIEQVMEPTTEAVMVTISVGKGRNIPFREGMVTSFVVVRVNDTDLGITEVQSGPDPSFMQDFKGQVQANPGTLVSLSFHQQSETGRDVLIGYVAVPLQRVLESGREEGWYDLRSHNDTLVNGLTGIAEILVSLSATALSPATGVPRDLSPKGPPSVTILRPRGLLEVLIGRTSNVNASYDNYKRKLACVISVGVQSRKTFGCLPEPDAVWEQGFQLPIYAPESDSVQIEVVDEPVDDIDSRGNRLQVSRYYGSCTLDVSQIINQLEVSGLAATAGWHLLHDGDSGAAFVGSNGSSNLQVAFAWRATPMESIVPVCGWMRVRDQQASLFFVLDPCSQVLLGYTSESEAMKEKPNIEFEVRGSRITSLASTDQGGEVTFDLGHDTGTVLPLAAPNQAEWERWFDILHRTSSAHELTTGVFPTVRATERDQQERSLPSSPTQNQRVEEHKNPTEEPATGPELILQITKPDNLIEVCIFRGRNIPLKAGQDDQSLGALQSAVVVQFGTQAYSTQASRPTASPVWNESLQLVCSEAPEDLITLIFWGWPQSEALPKASERTFLGHIAVPASRVKDVGREEGWYDLRDKHGNLVSGPEGTTAALVSFTVTPAVQLPHHVQGFIVSRSEDQDDVFERRYHLLDPYAQQLIVYSRLPLAGISEGEVHSQWNFRECHVEFGAQAALVLESAKDRDPSGYLVQGQHPFVVDTIQGRLMCCAESVESCRMWVQALESLGNSESMRKLDASIRTTGAAPPRGSQIQVVVERARNLPALSVIETPAYFCVVQLRESQATTAVIKESEAPKWAQSFDIPVIDADSDLITVQLWQDIEPDGKTAVGHVAVPVARVQGSGTEEGWYELRARDGELIMGGKGKATLLVRFRYSGPDAAVE